MPKIFKQSGVTLILFLVFLVLGLSAFVLSKLKKPTDWMLENQAQTAKVLRQAKEALIGFAMTYAETHPGQPQGYLPCPDHDGDGSASTCGDQGHSVIGRFPWKTMGLPPLRDGSGECLWYAVSGTYKNNFKQVLTSNDDGLFIVRNTNEYMITGDGVVSEDDLPLDIDTEVHQTIAIIFAPGKPLIRQDGKNQTRATTDDTECGDGALPDDYLDDYELNGTTYDNAKGTGTLLPDSSIAANFWVTNDPDQTSKFISAPLTYGTYNGKVNTGEVIFNDTLMLITPKDYAPVYKRMDFWVAERVTQCLRNYSKPFRDNYFATHRDIIGDAENPAIGTYRKSYNPRIWIDKYVAVMEAKYRADFHKEHIDEHPMPEPTTIEIDKLKKEARENAIDIDSQYPWATLVNNWAIPVNDPSYTDDVGERFGRIPQNMSNISNADMMQNWASTRHEDEFCKTISDWETNTRYDCFNETFVGLDRCEWGWWTKWKEMVFYAVDDDYVPNQIEPTTHLWVKAIKTKEDNGDWVDWVAWLKEPFGGDPDSDDENKFYDIIPSDVKQVEMNSSDVQSGKRKTFAKIILENGTLTLKFAKTETPSSSNTLQLGNSNQGFEDAQFVVLVAGMRLHLNKNSSDPAYPEYPQMRDDDIQKGRVKNYLEGRAKPLDPVTDNDPNDPEPDIIEMLRQIDGGGNIPVDGESDTIPSGDEIFIKKPIEPNYFNDVSCIMDKYDDTYDCRIPR